MSKVRTNWKDIVNNNSGGQGSSYFEIDINEFWLRIEATEEGNEYCLRLIGDPVEFFAHYDRVCTNPEAPWNERQWVTAKFPDSETVKKRRRICTDPYWKEEGRSESRCPWCRKHYQRSKKWYINCIDRKDGKLKLVELSHGTMEDIVKVASTESNERKYPDGPFSLHGKSPEWMILATKSNKGKVDYLVTKEEGTELTAEDWEAIANAPHNRNAKTEEERMKLIDLELYCKPSYLDEALQRAWFDGQVIDEVPKKRESGEQKAAQAPAESRPAESKPSEAPEAPKPEASKSENASEGDGLDEAAAEGDQDPGW
jgi:hypothetical protein